MQPHARQIPELQTESHFIPQKVCKPNRRHLNATAGQEIASRGTTDGVRIWGEQYSNRCRRDEGWKKLIQGADG